MKKILFAAALIFGLLTLPAFAALGKTITAFTDSAYAKELDLKLNLNKPDLTAYLGKGKELIIVKTRRDVVFYERLTWLNSAMPTDDAVRRQAYLQFLMQATEVVAGTPDYDQLLQNINGNVPEFSVKGYFNVRVKAEPTDQGIKHYVEVFAK